MSAIDTSKIDFPDVMGVREACVFLDLGEQRLRALVRTNEVSADRSSGRLMFKKSDLQAWKAKPRKTGGGGRKDGGPAGKAFVIHVTGDKLAAVTAALEAQGIKLEQRYNYGKMREYQKARNARIKAEKAAAKGNGTVPQANPEPVPSQAVEAPKGAASLLQRKPR